MEENMNMKSAAFPVSFDGVRKSYLRPEVEVYACEPPRVMAVSGGGAGSAGEEGEITDDPTGGTGGNPGGGGAIFGGGGAKRINEREISFSDVWEE